LARTFECTLPKSLGIKTIGELMGDDPIPFSDAQAKAVQEVAKVTGKALDLIDGVGRATGRVLGPTVREAVGMAEDFVSEVRDRNRARLKANTKDRLRKRGVEPISEGVSIGLIAPIVVAAVDEGDADIRELWERLLANALDPSRTRLVRSEFVDTIRHLHPNDAAILKSLYDHPGQHVPNTREFLVGWQKLSPDSVEVSLSNLEHVKCIGRLGQGTSNWHVTPFGRELMRAVAE